MISNKRERILQFGEKLLAHPAKDKAILIIASALGSLLLMILISACTPDQMGSALPGASPVGGGRVMLGIDVLESRGFDLLRGKRVGLITNQTSVNGRGIPTRQVLQRASNVNLTALYVPEHGIDGKEKAAVHIPTRRDPLTGLTAHSLYGPTRMPSRQQLNDIDVMLFDLQDIGSRSYTYISTMIRAMEGCNAAGKEFIVLDRPNPIGGLRVNGPPSVEREWISFVGQIPVPYCHGMTAGELARMSDAKGWVPGGKKTRLTVVPMQNWNRNMMWSDTGLRWVPTSPNIPNADSPIYYAATGIFGSLSGGDIGIGTNGPFEYVGGPGIKSDDLGRQMASLKLPGIRYSPYTSSNRTGYAGLKLQIDPRTPVDIVAINLFAIEAYNQRVSRGLYERTSASAKNIFYKVYGSKSIETEMKRGVSAQRIVASWKNGNAAFLRSRQSFLMYR